VKTIRLFSSGAVAALSTTANAQQNGINSETAGQSETIIVTIQWLYMRSTILSGVSLAAIIGMPALAQTSGKAADRAPPVIAAEADEAGAEMILVTGSRIARASLDAAVPITTLTAEELTNNGQISIGDRLALLPQFRPTFTTQNAGRFIGTAGLSVLDLRGQGTARTLVLQNGLRHVSSSPGTQQVDVNTMPIDLIERVDIVTGGNSAVYGSDAVAGVVNFVLKRNFEGLSLRAQTGISSRGDNSQSVAALTTGKNFADGRGNIAVSVEFSQQDPLYFRDRDWTGAFAGRRQFQLTEDTATSGPNNMAEPATGNGISDTTFTTGVKNIGFSAGGAFTSACPAATSANAARVALNCTGVFNSLGTTQFGNVFVFAPDGSLLRNAVERDFRPFGSNNSKGGLGTTLRETGLLQTGNTRYIGNLLASFEVSQAFRPFVETKFARTESVQEGQPTFLPGGNVNSSFSVNNAFLSPQARNLLVTSLAPGATTFALQRFNADFGARGEDHRRDLYRLVAGIDGTFLDTWRYQVALNYGRVDTFYQTEGNVARVAFNNATNAVRDASGNITCAINTDANPANDDPACRPLNIFGAGAPSAAALNYILWTSTREQRAEQINAIAFVSGDSARFLNLPGGPVGFSVGAEWRRDTASGAFDAFTAGGNTFLNAIQNFAPPRQDVKETFGELRLPVLKDVPFFNELTIEGAIRASNYNVGTTGTVLAYNGGAIWSPTRGIRFRGGYARAVRAPTQTDLFNPQNQTFATGFLDPCGQQNINANPNRVANCAAAGVPTTQTFVGVTEPFTNRAASGISGLSGGNPNLNAERSDSWTLGAVLQPAVIPGLTIAVDWYRIGISSAINTIAAQTVVDQCYDNPDGINNQFCGAVFRNPNSTLLGQNSVLHAGQVVNFPVTGAGFLQGPFNYARQLTEGIDLDVNYGIDLGNDWRIVGRVIVSYLITRNVFTSLVELDRLTQEKFSLGNPEWNGQLNLTVGYKALDLRYNFRYIGRQVTAVNFRDQFSEQGRPPENADARPFPWYPAITYSDVRLSAPVNSNFTTYLGIDNLFDQNPPLDTTGTGAGDAIYLNGGRFLYAGVQMKF